VLDRVSWLRVQDGAAIISSPRAARSRRPLVRLGDGLFFAFAIRGRSFPARQNSGRNLTPRDCFSVMSCGRVFFFPGNLRNVIVRIVQS